MQRGKLDDLLAFVAVGRERSFTKAAAKLGVSQSALSHTIRELEARLGVRLLTRTTRSVSPTTAGERLLQTLGPCFEEIDAQLVAVTELGKRPAGTIRVTATEYAADAILLPKLATLLRDYPDIKVEIIIDYGLIDIVAQRFDAGVRSGEQVAGHTHGGRGSFAVFQGAARAEEASGPDQPQLHHVASAPWRIVCVGV
jgi:DNA-binding transcriptional LysR family regulator